MLVSQLKTDTVSSQIKNNVLWVQPVCGAASLFTNGDVFYKTWKQEHYS